VAISSLLALAAAEEVKTYALPYGAYAGLPLAYGAAAPAYTYAAAAPAYTYAAAPAYTYAAAAPAYAYAAAPYSTGSQFHAQDEFGNLNYGYANLNSAKQEVGNTYGGVSGAYSYVDANGKLQQVTYVADALGFRTADSRLPVAPVDTGVAPTFNPEPLVAPIDTGVAPEPVQDTPEVAEARAAHLAAVEAAKVAVVERRRRSADPAVLGGASTVLTAPTPIIHNAPVVAAGYALPYGYAGLGYGYAGLGYGYAGLPYYG
jgi:hypothetical protein